jgi:hypothetical protein
MPLDENVAVIQEEGGYTYSMKNTVSQFEGFHDWDVSTSGGVMLGRIRQDDNSSRVSVLGFYGPKSSGGSYKQFYEVVKATKFSDRKEAVTALTLVHTAVLRMLVPSLTRMFNFHNESEAAEVSRRRDAQAVPPIVDPEELKLV